MPSRHIIPHAGYRTKASLCEVLIYRVSYAKMIWQGYIRRQINTYNYFFEIEMNSVRIFTEEVNTHILPLFTEIENDSNKL